MTGEREKRAARVTIHTFPSYRKQLELFAEEESNVLSMSDYLHRVIEEHIAVKILKQKIGRRVEQQ